MAKAMYLYDHFIQDELFCEGTIGASRAHLGHIGENRSPLRSVGHYLWVEGEAYNIAEVASELGLSDESLSALLLSAEKVGQLDACLNKLDGYFCAALYDTDRKKINLISDRYGMRLLYWYHKDGTFSWGSEVKAILAIDGMDRELDATSFDCFMDLGYLMGEHTWFEHIRLIKPATVIEYDIASDSVQQHHYWKWSEIKPSSMSFDQAVDELGERFIRAVARRFDPNERIGISLSGGLDSRAIFAAVNHLYPDCEGYAYTFGIRACDDITIAEQVIARSKWRHGKFHFTEDNWFDLRIEKVWNTDGMLNILDMHGGEFLAEISSHIDVNLNGYSGDAIIGGAFLARIPFNVRADRNNIHLVFQNYVNLINVEDDFYDIERVEPILQMNRVRRFTAMGTVNGLIAVDQRKPFFDNKIVELIFSLPDEYRANNKLYSAMLQKFFPKYFKDIPWQKTGKPAAAVSKLSIPRRAINKGVRIINGLFNISDKQNYQNYPKWIRSKEIAERLNRLLDPKTAKYTQLTDEDLKAKYLTPHLNNRAINKSNEILRATTIELYLKNMDGL